MNDLDALLKRLDDFGANTTDVLKMAVLRACQKIQGDAKRLCPVGRENGGRLRESITAYVEISGDEIVGKVGTNVFYAVFVEFGTGPVGAASSADTAPDIKISYRTTPWSFKDGDKWIYTRGQAPQPFLYPAFKQNEAEISNILRKAILSELKNYG